MHLIQVGERVVNLALVTDVAWETVETYRDGSHVRRKVLRVYLASPAPASVGASDWTTEARSIEVDAGPTADAVWGLVCRIAAADLAMLDSAVSVADATNAVRQGRAAWLGREV